MTLDEFYDEPVKTPTNVILKPDPPAIPSIITPCTEEKPDYSGFVTEDGRLVHIDEWYY